MERKEKNHEKDMLTGQRLNEEKEVGGKMTDRDEVRRHSVVKK